MEIIANRTLIRGKPGNVTEVPPGTVVEFPDDEARDMIKRGIAKAVNDAPSGDDHFDTLVDAIEGLDESAFGKDGKPSVKALEEFTGYDITASERDNAWAEYQRLTKDD